MPSFIHTALVDLLGAHPEALSYLLELSGAAPPGPLVLTTGTRSETFTLERRVDRAYLVGGRAAPTSFVLAEVQTEPDVDKCFAWALYLELGRSRYRCEGALVALTLTEEVRRWIDRAIVPVSGAHGTRRQLQPTVIALDRIDPALLLRPDRPYLAALAVAGHARAPDARSVAETAVDLTLGKLPQRLAVGQLDAILGMVNRALRAHLESRVMAHREYQSELFRGIFKKGKAEGKVEGKAEGKAKGVAEGILIVLKARGVPVNEAIRRRVLACTNLRTLDAWLRRASVAETAASVVGLKAPARAPARRGQPRAASAASAERKKSAAGAETKKSTGTRRAPHRP
jgi:hypothetical protein